MIYQKLAIMTIHDVTPSRLERILKTLDELNTNFGVHLNS
jgi:hypothetical protein